MNTHETYVSFEVAKLLKQAGFDWELIDVYIGSDIYTNPAVNWKPRNWNSHGFTTGDQEDREWCSAPTLSVAQRWLREVKKRHIEPKYFNNDGWMWFEYIYNPPYESKYLEGSDEFYSTYEEALKAGIKKCLEMILKEE